MRKTILTKAAAVALTLALALVIVGLPGVAMAAVTGVSISTTGGASYSIPVGGTVELNAVLAGTADGSMTYSWAVETGGTNVSLSSTTLASTTVTGVNPGTTASVKVTATDSATGTPYSATATITVLAMTISDTAITLEGGSSKTLTVGNVAGATTWSSSRDVVATVDPSSGLVVAVGAGTATITASNASGQSKTCAVTVTPIITIAPATQNITASNTSGTVQVRVDYGGDLIGALSSVSWNNSNGTAGSLISAPNSFTVVSPTTMTCTATFLSNSTGVNASTNITATINGSGSYTTAKTAVINVRTARYLTIEGPNTLNKTSRYGTYTVTLHEANGSVVDDDTSTVHWSWTSSYLKISSATLNDSRADMENGTAQIELYARYNTPTAGTKLYVWINSDTAGKVYQTIVISGLSSLPQTGQDFTLVYVFSGLCAALLVTAGVWYGIRKNRSEKA